MIRLPVFSTLRFPVGRSSSTNLVATIPADKELYQRQIEATDRQIDALVYKLYGLGEEEVAIVEGRDL